MSYTTIERVTGFFSLPRELRDIIYSLLAQPRLLQNENTYAEPVDGSENMVRDIGTGWSLSLPSKFTWKFLSLSRQFAYEYQEAGGRKFSLIFREAGTRYLDRPELEEWMYYVPRAEFQLLALCCNNEDCVYGRCSLHGDLAHQYSCIVGLCERWHLEEVVIKIYPCRVQTKDGGPAGH